MAAITLGLCASHTPLLTLTAEQWQHRAAADLANKELNLSDGRFVTYEQLLAEVGPRYADIVTPEVLARKEAICQAALDRMADALEQAAPDVVIIVGDDQRELFSPANQPAIAIYHGAEVPMMDKFAGEDKPQWIRDMGRGYWMDARHVIPGAPELGLALVRGLMDRDFDVASIARVDDPGQAAFGHAYGFIVKRLFRGRSIPVLPVLLNTYYPPNVPTARRCHDLGQAMAEVIAALPGDQRVAVIGSGGLSHFVVDETLDRAVMAGIASGEHSALRNIPRAALNSGSSEILNWVVSAGAVAALAPRWQAYQPIQRTPAGTGVGAAFAIWG